MKHKPDFYQTGQHLVITLLVKENYNIFIGKRKYLTGGFFHHRFKCLHQRLALHGLEALALQFVRIKIQNLIGINVFFDFFI